ncbi:MAG: hypothetical protein KGO48_15000, partial [Alphaproteobacteria bacterium]|nr:hypothetical protein [Alphaproteobacteria bacterium]
FGEHGMLSPAFAAWLVPFSIFVSAGILLGVLTFRWKVRIAGGDDLKVDLRNTAGHEPILTDSLAAAP